MKVTATMKRLMIFVDETDKYNKKSLSASLIERLKNEGCAGATVLRGTSGFGEHKKVHTTSILDLAIALPEIILLIDTSEKIDSILPIVEEMVQEGLLVIDEVEVTRLSK